MLIVEPDRTTAQRMAAALGRRCRPGTPKRRAGDAPGGGDEGPECVIIRTLGELYRTDPEAAEAVICSVWLPDGSGLNALDYLRGRAPHVPVILIGSADDAPAAVEAIRAGAVDFLTTSAHDLRALPVAVEKCLAHRRVKHENERLQRDLSTSLTELAVRNQQLQALVRQLENTVRTDDLTGLCNRRSLNEMLRRAWQRALRSERPVAFMMIDLDDFKKVNDRLGHLRGDEVLRATARLIRANCRQSDVPARYGGDEFCVLMPEGDAHEALQAARRILRANDQANQRRAAGEPRVGMSIGVARVRARPSSSSEELVRLADEALYAAKSAGKGRIMVRDRRGVRPAPGPAPARVAAETVPAATWE